MGQLPEQVPANLATLQRLQLEQQTVSESVRKADRRAAAAREHRRRRRSRSATPTPDPLSGMKAALAQLRTRYTEAHPDVKALAARVELLEAAQRRRADRADAHPSTRPRSRSRSASARRRSSWQELKVRLADVDTRIAAFQARVEAAPRREQEILVLTRDYQKLSENYTQLLTKKLDAEMAARLEQQQGGRQFRVLDPASLPERPSFPNPNLFALAGAIAGLLVGAGLAVVVDALDPTLKDPDEAAAVLGLPLLAVIPFVPPKEQRRLAAMRPPDAPDAARRRPVPPPPDTCRGRAPPPRSARRSRRERRLGVRFVECLPEQPSGPVLQQAVLGSGHYLAEEFRFLAAKVAALAASRCTDDRGREREPSRGEDDRRPRARRGARALVAAARAAAGGRPAPARDRAVPRPAALRRRRRVALGSRPGRAGAGAHGHAPRLRGDRGWARANPPRAAGLRAHGRRSSPPAGSPSASSWSTARRSAR